MGSVVKMSVFDIVPQCFSYEDGSLLRAFLSERIRGHQRIVLDFSGVYGLPSSFVNGAFADLMEEVSFAEIKEYLSFSNLTKQAGQTIRERLTRLSEKPSKLLPTA